MRRRQKMGVTAKCEAGIVMTQVLGELLDVDTVVERHAGEMVAQGMHAGLAVRDVVATTAVVPSRWRDDADRR
jgi:hypothetical protein